MKQAKEARGYRGGYLIGFIIICVVALRNIISFQGEPVFFTMISLLAAYALLYTSEPWLSVRLSRYEFFYFPLQTVIVLVLANLRPFTDMSCLLYVPLSMQVLRAFSRRAATIWLTFYVILLTATLLIGIGWLEGLALVLLYLAVCSFVISYDFLYSRTQADQAESQQLLADLQSAHSKLQEYAAQAEELAAARERNRLARELHDSVSQTIFSIRLTSQSARLLLEREPARVPELIDRLQTMTEDALAQLRSLIAQLRPPQKS
jgi:signal transduction histidine kinase